MTDEHKKYFASFKDLKSIDIPTPSMKRQIFHGDSILVGKNVIKAHEVVPMHAHPHEQLTYIESGECDVFIGEDRAISTHASAGSIAFFPSNVPHEVVCTSDEDVVAWDIFTPRRDDWIKQYNE